KKQTACSAESPPHRSPRRQWHRSSVLHTASRTPVASTKQSGRAPRVHATNGTTKYRLRYRLSAAALLKECQSITPLELAANDDIALSIDTMGLKDRLPDIQTDCRNRLHGSSFESWELQ